MLALILPRPSRRELFLGWNSSSGKRRYEEDPPHRCVEHTNGRVREFSASCDILVPKAKTSRIFPLLQRHLSLVETIFYSTLNTHCQFGKGSSQNLHPALAKDVVAPVRWLVPTSRVNNLLACSGTTVSPTRCLFHIR